MMNGSIDVFTLIALIAAIVVVLKLRSVLGQRTDDDDARMERRMRENQQGESESSNSDNVITLPTAQKPYDEERPEPPQATEEEIQQRIAKVARNDQCLMDGLKSIRDTDPDFDPEHFISGAQQAYEMIVTAFADGDLKILKSFLSDDVYGSFEAAIEERQNDGVVLDQTFVGINKSDIIEADVVSGTANVVVHFGSELISVTRDKDGNIIAGDPNEVESISDIWTFNRDISTSRARSNPNWKLVATQPPN